ncbi:MAG TPA: hypothetical protein VGG18_13830 [Granulicella sp.]|jgi:hypothetical protein
MVSSTNFAPSPELTISDIEQAVQDGLEALRDAPLNDRIMSALKFLIPPGYRPIAQLEEDGRKKRSTAAASNWTPETGEIVIYFERQQPESSESTLATMPVTPPRPNVSSSFEKMRWQVKAGLREDPLSMEPEERRAATRVAIQSSLAEKDITDLAIEQLCLALAEAEKAGKSFIALKWFRDSCLSTKDYTWAESAGFRQAVLSKAVEVGAVLTSTIPNPKSPNHPTTTIKLNRESSFARSVAPRYQPIPTRGGETASGILLRDRGRF